MTARIPPSRRQVLATLGAASVAALALPNARADAAQEAPRGGGRAEADDGYEAHEPPIQGRALPGLESIDNVVLPILEAHAIPGLSLAVARGGKLQLARTYGFADLRAQQPLRPETLFNLASVSKVVTGQTILKLVAQGRLGLGDRVFEILGALRPPEGAREDPRLRQITVEMCLHHTGGWNRKESGDPSGWTPRVKRALRIRRTPTPHDLIRYMMGVRLDFDPGTQQVYSNFGFVLLGAVIAEIAKQPYAEYAQAQTLHPMGATRMRLTGPGPGYGEGEAHRYALPSDHPIPGGNPPMVAASGGWMADCIDMARVMTAIDGSRTGTPWLPPALMDAMLQPAPGIPPAPAGHWMGLAWDQVERVQTPNGPAYGWAKDGGLAGIQTWVQHLPEGIDLVILCNSSPPHGQVGELAMVRPKVIEFLRGVRAWPEGDLFGDFN